MSKQRIEQTKDCQRIEENNKKNGRFVQCARAEDPGRDVVVIRLDGAHERREHLGHVLLRNEPKVQRNRKLGLLPRRVAAPVGAQPGSVKVGAELGFEVTEALRDAVIVNRGRHCGELTAARDERGCGAKRLTRGTVRPAADAVGWKPVAELE